MINTLEKLVSVYILHVDSIDEHETVTTVIALYVVRSRLDI